MWKDVEEKNKWIGRRNRKEAKTQRMDVDMMAVSVAVTQLTAATDETQHLHVSSTVTQHTICSADRALTPQTLTEVPLPNFLFYSFPFCYQGNKAYVLRVPSSFIK